MRYKRLNFRDTIMAAHYPPGIEFGDESEPCWGVFDEKRKQIIAVMPNYEEEDADEILNKLNNHEELLA